MKKKNDRQAERKAVYDYTSYNGEYVLDVTGLKVRFETDDDTVYAVNGVDLKLKRNTTLGLVGETGAGKTTTVLSLLKLISCPPGVISDGTILVNGRNVMELSDEELETMRGKEIAMIFQDPMTSLNPVMTVGDQIEESIILHEHVSREEAYERMCEILETVGISRDRAGEYPHQFSGGMRQRVVIAIAIACHPSILIADEPTTALDVTIQAQVLELMNKLKQKNNSSVVMITHDLGIVAETCDEVAVMYAGKIVEKGTLRDVFKNTLHPYTEGLFNSLPNMNDRNSKLQPIKGLIPDPTIIPKGCPFAERCQYAKEKCYEKEMQERWVSETHMVSCCAYEDPEFHLIRRTTDG